MGAVEGGVLVGKGGWVAEGARRLVGRRGGWMGMRAMGGWDSGWGAGWLAGMVYRARGAQATQWGVRGGRRVWGLQG